MAGWIALALFPKRPWVTDVATRLLIPGLIGVVYAVLMVTHVSAVPDGGGFGSLAAVQALFTVDALLLAGWVHYLAFDLFVGSWEATDAQRNGVPHLALLPCLFLTFMAGPAGLLLYLLFRWVWRTRMSGRAEVA